MLDRSIEEILSYGRMVNDTQTLAHYSRILLAIRDAKQLGRLSDLLTEKKDKRPDGDRAQEGERLLEA